MKKLALLLVSVMLSISMIACSSDDDGAVIYFYIVRHAETVSNVAHGLFGWRDSPLTLAGILATENQRDSRDRANGGLYGIDFRSVYSSTTGRAIDTARILRGYTQLGVAEDVRCSFNSTRGTSGTIITDPRLREINFGRFESLILNTNSSEVGAQSSLYGALFAEQLNGALPESFHWRENNLAIIENFTIFDFADGINWLDDRDDDVFVLEFDNDMEPIFPPHLFLANHPGGVRVLAESGAVLRNRIEQGIRAIAAEEAAKGDGNILLVAHGITILAINDMATNGESPQLIYASRVTNNSVLVVRYRNGEFYIVRDTWDEGFTFN